MKKIAFLLVSLCFVSLTKAQDIVLHTDFTAQEFGADFDNIGDKPAVTLQGITFYNVKTDFTKVIYGITGRVYLEAQTSEKNPGILEFSVPSAGNVTVQAAIGTGTNLPRLFALEKKAANGEWEVVKTFEVNENSSDTKQFLPYTAAVNASSTCILRVINRQSGQTQIASLLVEAYNGGNGEEGEYVSKQIIHEQFSAAPWEDKATTGNYNFTIPVGTSTGVMALTNCKVETDKKVTGASSDGRIIMDGKDAIVELPEVPSCGSIKINANSGSDDKKLTLQKKSGSSWVDVQEFNTSKTVADFVYELKSQNPVTLRLTNGTGSMYLYEIWVTDYQKATAITSLNPDKGRIVAVRYYDLRGMELQAQPLSGFFIQKIIYDNGSMETKKLFQSK
jgi:hypothetical protein